MLGTLWVNNEIYIFYENITDFKCNFTVCHKIRISIPAKMYEQRLTSFVMYNRKYRGKNNVKNHEITVSSSNVSF